MSLSTHIVDGLEPGTTYVFYAESLTVAGPSYEKSNLVEKCTDKAGLGAGHFAAIGIVVLIVMVFGIIGAVTCFK